MPAVEVVGAVGTDQAGGDLARESDFIGEDEAAVLVLFADEFGFCGFIHRVSGPCS